MSRILFKRLCDCYPSDSRPLRKRIREMLFCGVPLGENPDVKHDFENSSDKIGDWSVDFDSDIHNDVFDKMERASFISAFNAKRALENSFPADPSPADPSPADPSPADPSPADPSPGE